METKLEKQIDYFNKHNDVDFFKVLTFLNLSYLNEELYPRIHNNNENIVHEEYCSAIFGGNILTHGSMMIRKNV